MSEWRYLAQRVLTGEWLHTDLDLDVQSRTHELSAPGALRATISPDIGQLRTVDGRLLLEEWGTIIYAEADGIIRWGGLVVASAWNGPTWSVECAGFSAYPHGIPYDAVYSGIQVDPADVVRTIWAHLQAQQGGDLGVQVVGSTTTRIGTDPEDVEFTTGSGDDVAFTAGPYLLEWWDAPDCGREIDALAAEAPFDWVERHEWIDRDAGTVRHIIEVQTQLGRRRDDLRFEQGVNIVEVVRPSIDGDEYANAVLGLGAGEGKKSLRATAAVRDGRLRRVSVVDAKDVRSKTRLQTRVREELEARAAALEIDQIVVADHDFAPLESWQVGDIIPVVADLPWLGEQRLWFRIGAYTIRADGRAVIDLTRPDGR